MGADSKGEVIGKGGAVPKLAKGADMKRTGRERETNRAWERGLDKENRCRFRVLPTKSGRKQSGKRGKQEILLGAVEAFAQKGRHRDFR